MRGNERERHKERDEEEEAKEERGSEKPRKGSAVEIEQWGHSTVFPTEGNLRLEAKIDFFECP